MANIYSLKIKNFRGIRNFDKTFGFKKFICLVGRGDSCKTTLLEAISFALSPRWNLTFYDTDFFNCEINNPIEIDITLYDLPQNLLSEDKYGLYIRFYDNRTNNIVDSIDFEDHNEDYVQLLTIRLIIDENLEPKWFVVNNRENQENKEIRTNDRAALNVFLIKDYIDQHFSWNKGNPLYSLLKKESSDEKKKNIILKALSLFYS